MKVVCIQGFSTIDLPFHLQSSNIPLPQEGDILHVASHKTEDGKNISKAGMYYTFAEYKNACAMGDIWYHAERFRRLTDISALQALTVIKTKTKTKVLEDA